MYINNNKNKKNKIKNHKIDNFIQNAASWLGLSVLRPPTSLLSFSHFARILGLYHKPVSIGTSDNKIQPE